MLVRKLEQPFEPSSTSALELGAPLFAFAGGVLGGLQELLAQRVLRVLRIDRGARAVQQVAGERRSGRSKPTICQASSRAVSFAGALSRAMVSTGRAASGRARRVMRAPAVRSSRASSFSSVESCRTWARASSPPSTSPPSILRQANFSQAAMSKDHAPLLAPKGRSPSVHRRTRLARWPPTRRAAGRDPPPDRLATRGASAGCRAANPGPNRNR